MAGRAPIDRPSRQSARFDRRPGERALAWLYTGPLGRLWGTLADVAGLWIRWIAGRVRARATGARS